MALSLRVSSLVEALATVLSSGLSRVGDLLLEHGEQSLRGLALSAG